MHTKTNILSSATHTVLGLVFFIKNKIILLMIIIVIIIIILFAGAVKEDLQGYQPARIINGRPALMGEFPYQAQLGYTKEIVMDCGATIIDAHHLLTAAHCVKKQHIGHAVIAVGSIYRSNLKNHEDQLYAVDQFYESLFFDEDTFQNDIALVRIKGSFTFGEFVRPIPFRTEPITKGDCSATGWGVLVPMEEDPVLSDVLNEVTLPLVDRKSCQAGLEKFGIRIFPGMLCAGNWHGGKDVCQGDSGGPLVCDHLLTGIISFGKGCARPQAPGVYTEVAFYEKWIKQTLRQSFDEAGIKYEVIYNGSMSAL